MSVTNMSNSVKEQKPLMQKRQKIKFLTEARREERAGNYVKMVEYCLLVLKTMPTNKSANDMINDLCDHIAGLNWWRIVDIKTKQTITYNIAKLYLGTKETAPDLANAAKWFKKSVECANHFRITDPRDYPLEIEALIEICNIYASDNLQHRDLKQALNSYVEAEQKISEYVTQKKLNGKSKEDVVAELNKAMGKIKAAKGNELNDIGGWYFNQKKYEEAKKWWETAADKNLHAAKFNLGMLYHTGTGVKKDLVVAAKYFLSVDQGQIEVKELPVRLAQVQASASIVELVTIARNLDAGKDGFPKDLAKAGEIYKLLLARASIDELIITARNLEVAKDGFPKDLARAREIYKKVVERRGIHLSSAALNPSNLAENIFNEIIQNDVLKHFIVGPIAAADQKSEVERLVKLAASVKNTQPNSRGLSPLHLAVIFGHTNLIEPLLKAATCNFHEKDCKGTGHTPLEYAAALGNSTAIAFLLNNGADCPAAIEAKNNKSKQIGIKDVKAMWDPLKLAIAANHEHALRALYCSEVVKRAVLTTDDQGNTPLHIAASCDSDAALDFLLKDTSLGGDGLRTKNHHGQTPLYLAIQNNRVSVFNRIVSLIENDYEGSLEDIIDRKSNNDETPSIAETPLETAMRVNNIDIFKKLLNLKPRLTKSIKDKALKLYSAHPEFWYALNPLASKAQHDAIHLTPVSDTEALKKVRNLVFKGGGVKGYAYLSLLQDLDKKCTNFLKPIARVGGTSAGSITAFLLAIGYDVEAVTTKMANLDYKKFLDLHDNDSLESKLIDAYGKNGLSGIWDLLKKELVKADNIFHAFFSLINPTNLVQTLFWAQKLCDGTIINAFKEVSSTALNTIRLTNKILRDKGLFSGESAVNFFKEWLRGNNLPEDLTFDELHQKKNSAQPNSKYKDLYVVVQNVNTGYPETLSWENAPNVLIVDAVRASMSLPLFFQPVQLHEKVNNQPRLYKNDYYMDGGICMNYPIDIFDRKGYLQNNTGSDGKSTIEPAVNYHTRNPETLGFYLADPEQQRICESKQTPIASNANETTVLTVLSSFVATKDNAEEIRHVMAEDQARAIYINTGNISTFDFNFAADEKKKEFLSQASKEGLGNFLKRIQQGTKKLSRKMRKFLSSSTLKLSTIGCHSLYQTDITAKIDYTKFTPTIIYEFFAVADKNDMEIFYQDNFWLPIYINRASRKSGKTALHYAIAAWQSDTLIDSKQENLRQKNINKVKNAINNLLNEKQKFQLDTNAVDKSGDSILDLAANKKLSYDLVKQLIEAGAVVCNKIATKNYLCSLRQRVDVNDFAYIQKLDSILRALQTKFPDTKDANNNATISAMILDTVAANPNAADTKVATTNIVVSNAMEVENPTVISSLHQASSSSSSTVAQNQASSLSPSVRELKQSLESKPLNITAVSSSTSKRQGIKNKHDFFYPTESDHSENKSVKVKRYKQTMISTFFAMPKDSLVSSELQIRNLHALWEAMQKVSSSSPSRSTLDLKTVAGDFGYACHNVEGDGNCFYRAVAHQIQSLQLNVPALNGRTLNHETIRALTVQHVIDNLNLYRDSFVGNLNELVLRASTPGEWADHVFILGCARVLNLNLAIIRNTDSDHPNIFCRRNPVGTIYLGYEDEVHYQSLLLNRGLTTTKNIQGHIARAQISSIDNWEPEQKCQTQIGQPRA